MAMSLSGYPFILPDMVGGNEYDEKADADMMIRWTQLNALLPSMQFVVAAINELWGATVKKHALINKASKSIVQGEVCDWVL